MGFLVCELDFYFFFPDTWKSLWCGVVLVLDPFCLMSGVQHLQVVMLLYFGLVRALYSMCAAYSNEHRDVDHTGQKLHLLLQSPWGTSSVELTV